MRRFASLLFAIIMLITCISHTSAEESMTVITIWHTLTGVQEDSLISAANSFNTKSDQYRVDVISQPYVGFTDTVRTAVRNGVGPDIIINYATEAANYVADGQLVDLSQYIYADEEFAEAFETSLPQEVMDVEVNGFDDGLIHYLPSYTTGPILYYNATLYDELGLTVPSTWEELAENCRIIKEKKGLPGLGFECLPDCIQMLIMETEGCTYIDVENKCIGFNTPEMREKIRWFTDCVKEGLFQYKATSDYFSTDFSNGIVASFAASCGAYPYVTPNEFDFRMAPIPAQTWYPSWNCGPIAFYYGDDARAEGTYEFIRHFISPEINLDWIKAITALPPYSWTRELEEYQEFMSGNTAAVQALNAVAAHLDISGSLPTIPGSSTVRDETVNAIMNIVNNGMSVEDAMHECEIRCNAALQGK